MIQNALMVVGLRARPARRVLPAAVHAGGVIRAGAGAAGAAGPCQPAPVASGAGGLARQGVAYARTAAYKLAALRGRT